MTDYVYFLNVQGTQKYKVGWSADPYSRRSQLQVGNHELLIVYKTIPVNTGMGEVVENFLHGLFKANIPGKQKYIRGEFFEIDTDWIDTVLFELRTRYNNPDWGLGEIE